MKKGLIMYIFTCNDRFEDVMCCIYRAWELAIKVGHSNVKLLKEPVEQLTLMDEYIHVDFDKDLFDKVTRSIKKKISINAYYNVYYASLAKKKESPDIIYRFLVKGFKMGADVMGCMADEEVWNFLDLGSSVRKEAEHFKEFARFNSLDNQLYVCHLEPKSDIIAIVAWHFEDRMPSENWLIIDDTRRYAIVHPKDDESYVRYFTNQEMESLSRTEQVKDIYTQMWKTFFDAIAIKERTNLACQMNHMPLWKRKHMTEYK